MGNLSDILDAISAVTKVTVRDIGWITGITDPSVGMMDGPSRFQDFRRSDNIDDRRGQKYSQNPDAPPDQQTETVGREQGTGFDYDYLSSVIRIALGESNPLSISAGINDIK